MFCTWWASLLNFQFSHRYPPGVHKMSKFVSGQGWLDFYRALRRGFHRQVCTASALEFCEIYPLHYFWEAATAVALICCGKLRPEFKVTLSPSFSSTLLNSPQLSSTFLNFSQLSSTFLNFPQPSSLSSTFVKFPQLSSTFLLKSWVKMR